MTLGTRPARCAQPSCTHTLERCVCAPTMGQPQGLHDSTLLFLYFVKKTLLPAARGLSHRVQIVVTVQTAQDRNPASVTPLAL